MKMCVRSYANRKKWIFLLATTLVASAVEAQNGDGNAGINQATTMVKGYFDSGAN